MDVKEEVSVGPAAATPAAGVRTGPALVALAGAAWLAVLDGTVVAVALGSLADAFGTPLTTVVWVTIAYLLAAATALPLLGWASARFGGRAVFLTGLGLFLLGSALCALARSPGMLIGFRVLQGFGGGLLEPSAMTLSAALATRESMGRVLSVMATVVNVAPAGGPILGGLLLQTGHWQWLFVVNIPLGLLVGAAALAYVPAGRPAGRTPGPGAPAPTCAASPCSPPAISACCSRSTGPASRPAAGWSSPPPRPGSSCSPPTSATRSPPPPPRSTCGCCAGPVSPPASP